MSENEIAIPSKDEALALMQEYGAEAGTDADERFRANVNEKKLIPAIVMSKESLDLTVKVGDNVTSTRRNLFVTFVDVFGTRALWPPESDKEKWGKQPVCAHGFADPVVFKTENDRGTGTFTINDSYPAPYDSGMTHNKGDRVKFECKRCPWNKFESISDWDSSKKGKAKACNEGRTMFVKIMDKINGSQMPVENEELFFFRDNPGVESFATLAVTMGTNRKAIEDLFLMVSARKFPMRACVFKIGVKHDTAGAFKFAVLTAEFAGLVAKPTFNDIIKPLGTTVTEFVKRNTNYISDADVAAVFG